ncbi:MAG: hypothetical protein ACN4EP_00595 [Sediminibacterium sp.]
MNSNLTIDFITETIHAAEANPVFNGRAVRFTCNTLQKDELESNLKELKIEYEFHLNNQCEFRIDVPYNDGQLLFFYDDADFLKRSIHYIHKFNDIRITIFFHEGKPLDKLAGDLFTTDKAIIFNFNSYHQILQFLEGQEHFMSVHSKPDRQFVIFSSETGPFYIGYDLHEPRIKNLENLDLVYNSLTAQLQKIDFVQYFKSAVIQAVHEYPVRERFYYLIQSLRVILSVAERDHYVYIRNFNFEKIKSKFKEERNRYMESIEKNIESVNKQVTSFPLTFAASAFAGFQVKDKPAILILIAGAYFVYTIVAYKVLSIASYNVEGVKADVEAESDKLKKGYEIVFKEFEGDFTRINTKLAKTTSLIAVLKGVLVSLLLAFLVFAVYEIFFVKHNG